MRRLAIVVSIVMFGVSCGYPQPADVPDLPIDAFVPMIDAPGTSTMSCMGLAATCGATSSGSCCESPTVTGGTFFRSFDTAVGTSFTDMTHPATVSDFRLDKYEITVGRFRKFVDANEGTQTQPPVAGSGAHTKIAGSGWDASFNPKLTADLASFKTALKCDSALQTWTDAAGANEDLPINCITWFEAQAFCTWDGGYLASEAEWNYAAAGGNMQRALPWSSPASSTNINGTFASYLDGSTCTGDGQPAPCTRLTDLIKVGSKPAGDSAFGQSDMGGNVYEWTLDAFASTYGDPCLDCADLAVTSSGRTARGGAFNTTTMSLRSAARSNPDPSSRNSQTGARCARALQ